MIDIRERFDWTLEAWRESLTIDLKHQLKASHDAIERIAGNRPLRGCDKSYWRGVHDVMNHQVEMTRMNIDLVDELRRSERYLRHLDKEMKRRRQRLWRKTGGAATPPAVKTP